MSGLRWIGNALCLCRDQPAGCACVLRTEAVECGGCAPPVQASLAGIPPGSSVLRGPWPEGVLVEPTAPPVVPDPPES